MIDSICEAYQSIYVLHTNHTVGKTTFLSSAPFLFPKRTPFISYKILHVRVLQTFFLEHLFLRLYSLQQKYKCKTQLTIIMKHVSNQRTITPKVQMMFQKNNNSLDQRKVMETVLHQGLGLHTNHFLMRNLLNKIICQEY